MNNSFKTAVRNKKVKSPTERGFDLNLWNEKWIECGSASQVKEEYDVYLGGQIINELLREIRSTLGNLYKRRPNLSKKDLIKSHVAFSNRNIAILIRPDVNKINATDIHSLSTTKNSFEINITYQEMAEQNVESIKSALRGILTESIPAMVHGDMDILEFVQTENALSGLYRIYEDYWSALLWGEYELNVIDLDNKVYEVKQRSTDLVYEITQSRKMKLDEHAKSFIFNIDLGVIDYTNLGYIKISGSGKTRKIKTGNLLKADSALKFSFLSIKSNIRKIESLYPPEFFSYQYKTDDFTVKDAFEVFLQLAIFSESIVDRFPRDDSVYNAKKLTEFCPSFKVQELALCIAKATGIPSAKIYKIMDFLTYKGQGNEDLWCHPIIDVGDNEVVILVSAVIGSVLQRVAEHWFVSFGLDLTKKGMTYENLVINSVTRSIERNPIIKNYDSPISKRFKLDSGEEEIDFLMRLGRTLIVGESKSIVTTDSSISHFRTIGVIAGAKEQVLRKAEFVRQNMKEIFSSIDWQYEPLQKYEILPLIFVSNKIHSGFPYEDVQVTDEILLAKYLSGQEIPLLSDTNSRSIAWFDLYETESEAVANLDLYLSAPPQITKSNEDYYYKSMDIPCIEETSIKIIFTRFVLRDTSPSELINRKFSFPLKTADDFEEIVSEMKFLM